VVVPADKVPRGVPQTDGRFGDDDFYRDHTVGDGGYPGSGGLFGRALGRRW
jgi:hypothetical protein